MGSMGPITQAGPQAQGDDEMATLHILADDCMSNTRYHAAGKPTWWVRIGDRFLAIPSTRGDQKLDVTVTVDRHPTEPTIVHYGVGPADRHGVRGKKTVGSAASWAARKAATDAAQASE